MIKTVSKLYFNFFSNYSLNSIVDIPQSLTELYFNEHFEEIRQRIFHTLIFLSVIIFFIFCDIKVVVKILETPVSNVQFFQLSPGEYFISTLKISLYIGMLFSTPIILSQTLFFFRPALNKSEKNLIGILLISSVILFFIGLFFSYFFLIPAALNFFINYSADVIEPFWSFEQYFGFVSALFFSTGLVFQVPILQIILSLSKIINPKQMLKCWRPMILFSTIIGAILTPSADPFTQLLLSGALFILYFSGSLISIFLTKKIIK
ncbi:unnamed protein product [Discosporangium mesarthrocarpum]